MKRETIQGKRDYLPRSSAYCLQDKSSSDPTDKDVNKIVLCDGNPLVSFHMRCFHGRNSHGERAILSPLVQ